MLEKCKRAVLLTLTVAALLGTTSQASAAETYRGYQYNEWDESVPTPNGYLVQDTIRGEELESGAWLAPKDLYVYNNMVYLLDSGNNRIVIMDEKFSVIQVLDTFSRNGVSYQLNAPSGIYVADKNTIIIADTGNAAVVVCDGDGVISMMLIKPESALFPQNQEFKPTRVLKDAIGNYYAVIEGLYYGAVCYNSQGEFTGFFGSNEVKLTASVLLNHFWKRFMSNEQISYTENVVPVGYSSFDIDGGNFIYTSTNQITLSENEIRKLDPSGKNILPDGDFGDLEYMVYKSNILDTSFVDVCVDEEGYIYGLDVTRGRVFQFDEEGNKIFIFGGQGLQEGTFKTPAAVDTLGERVLVLDAGKNSVTVFGRSAFGKSVHQALRLFNEGLYDEARDPWEEVLSVSPNFQFAYVSIGKSLFSMGQYKEAMEYFRMGNDRTNESKAFAEYRTEWMQTNIFWLALSVALLVCALALLKNRVWLRNRVRLARGLPAGEAVETPYGARKGWRMFTRLLAHPISGSEEIKYKKTGSMGLAAAVVAAWFISTILSRQFTSFRFNQNRLETLNVFYLFIGTVVLFILFCLSNWAICTLLDGEAKLKEVFIILGYGLAPFVASQMIHMLASHVMTLDASVFLGWIMLAGGIWSGILIIAGLSMMHQYSIRRTLLSILLTLIGVVLMLFLIVLFIILCQQVVVFACSVIQELMMHF